MKKGENTSGQALLIILLVLSVALTTGLALVARTTTDISISEKETASSKAFEAAEAGIEEALKAIEAGQALPTPFILRPGGEEAAVKVVTTGEVTKRQIFPGQATTFWLNKITLNGEDFPAGNISYGGTTLTFCWKGADNLEAAVYYKEGVNYKVSRYYLAGGTGCQELEKGAKIDPLPAGAKFVNVRFYSTDPSKQLTVTTNEVLPRQGTTVEAEAKVGDVVRKISVFQGWPQVPQFFDFAVLSEGSLTKTE
jgi:hypothetical protein